MWFHSLVGLGPVASSSIAVTELICAPAIWLIGYTELSSSVLATLSGGGCDVDLSSSTVLCRDGLGGLRRRGGDGLPCDRRGEWFGLLRARAPDISIGLLRLQLPSKLPSLGGSATALICRRTL